MSNYPTAIDDDSSLPPINNNLTELGGDAINALRDAVFQIETVLGTNIAGSSPSLAARLGVFINPDGSPNASVIYSLGLVTLPIYNSQVADAAAIQESKLSLDYSTQNLFNRIRDLARDVNLAIGWISVTGIKLEPHLFGAIYRHDLAAIDVAEVSSQFLDNVFRVLRNNTNAYTLVSDINNELLSHQWADGSPFGVISNITTNDGSTYPSNYAHVASGIFLDTSGFSTIPQTAINEQLAWNYIDQSSLLTLGTRIQNLYANGISVNSRSSSLITDGYGQPLVPVTPAIAYLRDTYSTSFPFDDIAAGDDIIQLIPSNDDGYSFEEQFALVRVGDIIRVNYANDGYFVEVPFVISEKKYIPSVGTNLPPTFIIRIAGKNIAYSPNALARIDKPLFNNNKQGVLAISGVNSTNLPIGTMPSLIVANPRGAQCLGVGFSPDQFNETHYFLYLVLYPDGNPLDGYTILPPIDVTGNGGTTPGNYTLDSIVNSTNLAFRQAGFNYRFVAFQYDGEFGIMLADAYNNVSFSVINGSVTGQGSYSQSLSEFNFPNNVIDLFPSAQTVTSGSTITLPVSTLTVASTAGFNLTGTLSVTTASGVQSVSYTGISGNIFTGVSGGTGSVSVGSAVTESLAGISAPDPLGFGPFGSGVSSPVFMTSYSSVGSAIIPTIIFPPLRRNNFYVNGAEQEQLLDYVNIGQVEDSYGDGYWNATIQTVTPGISNVSVTYLVPLDLSASGLKAGKTLVVQPSDGYNFGLVNYGRFIISNVNFLGCSPVQTEITVYDAVSGVGGSPYPVAAVGSPVALYFNNDSVSFNNETATDFQVYNYPFKRHFEVYVDDNGDTFTHERARFNPSGSSGSSISINAGFGSVLYGNAAFSTMDIVSVSPTLRGYQFGNVNKINLNITNFSATTGEYTGYLSSFDGTNFLSQGEITTGRIGEIVRFYDQSTIDYIDVIFNLTLPLPTFTNQYIDIQLLPTLSLDQEIMILGTVEVNGTMLSQFRDLRQFGNISEEQLTTSALNYIALPEKLLHFNGVVRGFDFLNNDGGPTPPTQYETAGFMSINGGVALTNGNFNYVNPEIFLIPALQETYQSINYPINYALCVNSDGDLVTIILTDFDPIIGTPNAPQRVVSVINVVSSTTYLVDATNFSTLLNNRKDLTPLYIVSAVVTGAGATAATTLSSIRDVRRFINDSDSEVSAVLTSDNSQGNFKTLGAAVNWLNFNSQYQNVLQIKGTFIQAVDPGLIFPLTMEAGGSVASITFSSSVNAIADVTFNGLILVFSSTMTAGNVTFNNCIITISGISVLTNVTLNNCTLTAENVGNWTDVIINSSIINVANTLNITNFVSESSTFNVSATQGFTLGSNISFENSTFNYTANPIGVGSYNTTDLVNASSGMLYAMVGSNLSNIKITGCIFTNSLSDHFPFVSFELSNYFSIIQNVNISNNAFASSASSNDIRAVISFIGTESSHLGAVFPPVAALAHVIIDNNICNYDQMIIISCIRITGIIGGNPTPLLSATNVRVSGNTCGTIGFITAVGATSTNDNSVVLPPSSGGFGGFTRNKKAHLIIEKNTCKFIGNLDATGTYIPFYLNTGGVSAYPASVDTTLYVQSYTGAVTINENAANWIQVGYYGTENNAWAEPNTITNNKLSPNNPFYLNNFIDTVSLVGPPNVAILVRRAFDTTSSAGQSLIRGNTISQGNFLNSAGSPTVYYYDAGIVTYNHANILANQVVGGVVNNGPLIWIWGEATAANGPTVNVQQNMLDRGGITITGYVAAAQNTATNNVTITNNIFDSTTIDGSSTNVGLAIPQNWTFAYNTNQTFYVEIGLLDNTPAIANTGGIGPSNTTSEPAAPNTIYYSAESGAYTVGKGGFLSGPNIPGSSQYTVFTDSASGSESDTRTFTVDIPVDRFLPPSVRIVNAQLGAFATGVGTQLDFTSPTGTYNAISVTMLQYNNILTSNSAQGVLDVANNYTSGIDYSVSNALVGAFYINTGLVETALKTQTKYITVNLAGQTWVTGNNYRIAAEINYTYKRSSSPIPSEQSFTTILSPLVLTCIYE